MLYLYCVYQISEINMFKQKKTFILHNFELHSYCIALFLVSNVCHVIGKSGFIFGEIEDWNVFVDFIILLNVLLFWISSGKGLKQTLFFTHF